MDPDEALDIAFDEYMMMKHEGARYQPQYEAWLEMAFGHIVEIDQLTTSNKEK